jgi:hypothetical protein
LGAGHVMVGVPVKVKVNSGVLVIVWVAVLVAVFTGVKVLVKTTDVMGDTTDREHPI